MRHSYNSLKKTRWQDFISVIAILLLCFSCVLMACAKSDPEGPAPVVVPPVKLPDPPGSVAGCKKCVILAEQAQARIVIADVDSKTLVWEWKAANSAVRPEDVKWFSNPSDAKIVYNGKYVLTTASGGGVALIRIADKKTMFYAFAGGNTHSAELLPDGNIVTASSTDNYLMLFKVDTLHFPADVNKKVVPIEFGHNVVWDAKNQLLWSAAMNKLKAFKYNFDCNHPDLTLVESIALPGTEAHDLFPVYNENALYLTNTTNVYLFDLATRKLTQANTLQENIKCVSSGPQGYPTIMLRPKESWWTDEVSDDKGNTVFIQNGLKLYKARWVLTNTFSYPANDSIRQCN